VLAFFIVVIVIEPVRFPTPLGVKVRLTVHCACEARVAPQGGRATGYPRQNSPPPAIARFAVAARLL